MSLTVPRPVMLRTESDELEGYRADVDDCREVEIPTADVTDDILAEVHKAALRSSAATYAKGIEAIQDARQGRFRVIPHKAAIPEVLLCYLNQDPIDGWVYAENEALEYAQPYLVIDVCEAVGYGPDYVAVKVASVGVRGASSLKAQRPDLDASDPKANMGGGELGLWNCRPGRPETVLRRNGLKKETQALRANYDAALERMRTVLDRGFGTSATVTGPAARLKTKNRDDVPVIGLRQRPVIVDTGLSGVCHPSEPDEPVTAMPAVVPADPEFARWPVNLPIEVFDPAGDEPLKVHPETVTIHEYDDAVAERLILPSTHRRLLDVLTHSLGDYSVDVIDGKTCGNLILCKGEPGVGKTLTAQVYAEVLHQPLYSVDLGILQNQGGYGFSSIREGLQTVFDRVRRWDAVLLIDEADVLVSRRGDDLGRNAMTADFLRVLETFERLTFLTTNRPDDIDEAILSRCTAVISYRPPTGPDAVRTWETLAKAVGIELPDGLAETLAETFPGVPPRDMRQLLRLAARVAHGEDRPIDRDLVVECSVFRGLTPNDVNQPEKG